MQVGNLKRFVQRADQSFGGLVAPHDKPNFQAMAEGILTIGPGDKYGYFWDYLSEAGGPEWVEQPDNAGKLIFKKTGLYEIHSYGYDFRGALVLDSFLRMYLRQQTPQGANVGVAFNMFEVKVTAGQVSAQRANATENNGLVATRFFHEGDVVSLLTSGSPGVPAGLTAGMEFYAFPLAFRG